MGEFRLRDKINGGFLTKLCGKTYLNFQDKSNKHRDAYLWKDDVIIDACDKDWVNYERHSFQDLYKRGDYNGEQLDFYLNKCKKVISSKDILWIKNDVALAAYKNNDSKQCLNQIAEIENNPAFSKASEMLKKSVAFNKTKCIQLSELVPWILYTGIKENFVTKTVGLKTLSNTFYPVKDFDIEPEDIDKTQKTIVTYIGQINGLKVYDVLYPLIHNDYKYLKAIYLEKQRNQFMSVYYTTVDKDVINSPEDLQAIKSFIVLKKNLVASEVPISGTGCYVDDMYLYVPPDILINKNQVPHLLNTDIILNIVKQKIPPGYDGPRKGNPFDITTLNFSSPVYKPEDCNADPTGGTIDIQFKLVNDQLEVESAKYTP